MNLDEIRKTRPAFIKRVQILGLYWPVAMFLFLALFVAIALMWISKRYDLVPFFVVLTAVIFVILQQIEAYNPWIWDMNGQRNQLYGAFRPRRIIPANTGRFAKAQKPRNRFIVRS